jgi:hypothetical protein
MSVTINPLMSLYAVTGGIISVRVLAHALLDMDYGEQRNWLYSIGLIGLVGSIVWFVATSFPNL